MKSGYRILAIIIASLFIFSTIGASAAINVNGPDSNGKITILGTAENAGEDVTIMIFGNGKTQADLAGMEDGSQDVSTIFIYGDEKKSEADKSYSFEFNMAGGSGRYKAYVGNNGQLSVKKIEYVNPINGNAAARTLNASLDSIIDANGLLTAVPHTSETELDLGFYSDLYDELKAASGNPSAMEQEVYTLVLNSIKTSKLNLDADGVETVHMDAPVLFKLCVIKYAMDNELTYSFEAAAKDITFGEGTCFANEFPKLESEDYTDLETRIKADSGSNGRAFEENLEEQLVLTRIENTGGFTDTAALVKNYTGLSTSGINNEEWEELGGVYYASYELLDEALEPYRTDDDGEEGSDDTSSDTDDPSGADNSQTGAFPAGTGGGSGGGSIVKPDLDEEVEVPTEEKPLVAGFKDIPTDAWYKNEVSTLVEKGYISGRGDGRFEPEENITRCEIAKLVTLIAALTATGETGEFSDVADGHWAYDYIKAAADNGIVLGVGDGKFAPDVNITRQDLAVMISRVIAVKAEAAEAADEEIKEEEIKLGFKDADKASDYAVSAIAELVELKIINGYEDNTFRPENYVTRAEAAKLLCGLLEIIG